MGWRIICIEKANRLNYKLNSLGVLYNEEMVWICLDEIDTIIIETLICNTSFKLLSEIVKKGITLIICGENHMPIGCFNNIVNNQRSAKYNRLQLLWKNDLKRKIWKEIVKQKILSQAKVLEKNERVLKSKQLEEYALNVEDGDITNREGHAAKVYFNELFGMSFVRKREADDIINSSLNYIYQIIRSKISQEIIAHGYMPSLGIFHCSEYNFFGLADDLIEVYRPIVDYYIFELIKKEDPKFLTSSIKQKILEVLYENVTFGKTKQKIIESIRLYVISVTNALSLQDYSNLEFPKLL